MNKVSNSFIFCDLTAMIVAAIIATPAVVFAGTVVVTPGSLAGYTYFPPVSSSGADSTGGGSVSTLLRCYKQPSANDRTIDMGSRNWYDLDKPVQVYVRAYGGDGGRGSAGGGGGSSAILKNGVPVVIAPGGDGGKSAQLTTVTFSVSKNDTLRFIIGGGGGGSYGAISSYIIGGSGGAGYKGGGGGASSTGKVSAADTTIGGKGGGSNPGAGGFVTPGNQISGSSMPGTSGNGSDGGVGTWPDGSSQPLGAYGTSGQMRTYSTYFTRSPDFKQMSYASRWPASLSYSGSVVMGSTADPYMIYAGAGGGAGSGGILGGSSYSDGAANWVTVTSSPNGPARISNYFRVYSNTYYPDCGYAPNAYETYPAPQYDVCTASKWPASADSFDVPRQIDRRQGSYPGLIVVMFQAPTCELIPNHDEQ